MFTLSILSIAQTTASLPPSASWLFSDRSSSSKLVLRSRPAAMWVATAVSSLQPLRFNTLSLVFTLSILSIAQPTASLPPTASWLFRDRWSFTKLVLCAKPAAMWVATAVSSPQHLRYNTLSLVFTVSILSIAQPTASLSPSASWRFSDRSSSSKRVLCSNDLNKLTAFWPLMLPFWNRSTCSLQFPSAITNVANEREYLTLLESGIFLIEISSVDKCCRQ